MKKKILEKLIYVVSSVLTLALVFTFCYTVSSFVPKEKKEVVPENAKYIAKITYIYKGSDTYYLTDYDKYGDCYSFYTCINIYLNKIFY